MQVYLQPRSQKEVVVIRETEILTAAERATMVWLKMRWSCWLASVQAWIPWRRWALLTVVSPRYKLDRGGPASGGDRAGRSLCVLAQPAPPGAPGAEAAPARVPPIPVRHGHGKELRGSTQRHELWLVCVAVKMRVLTLFTLGLMRGIA